MKNQRKRFCLPRNSFFPSSIRRKRRMTGLPSKEHLLPVICLGLLAFPTNIMAEETDPFAAAAEALRTKTEAESIKVVYEVFSLPMTQAAELQRAGLSDTAFYAKMVEGLKNKTVKQEVFMTARANDGRTVEVAEVREYLYATEFDPPELPNQISEGEERGQRDKEKMKAFPVTPGNPTSYRTKRLGNRLEVEVTRVDDLVELRIAPGRVALIQKDVTGQGVAKIEMPRFSNPHLETKIKTRSGKSSYLGTVSAPLERQPKEGEQRVFFAFVTATVIAQ